MYNDYCSVKDWSQTMIERFMAIALEEAQKAYRKGEVPIGAVIVHDGIVIGRGHNLRETSKDPTAHAEMIAIRAASETLGGWRLIDCDMYVTIEPCPMCAGAIYQSRISNLYIGAMDPKAGAVGSLYNIPRDERLNHLVNVEYDILQEPCSRIMKDFFKRLRNK